jgi:hypothetical protein
MHFVVAAIEEKLGPSEDRRREQPETPSAFLTKPVTAIPFAATRDAR